MKWRSATSPRRERDSPALEAAGLRRAAYVPRRIALQLQRPPPIAVAGPGPDSAAMDTRWLSVRMTASPISRMDPSVGDHDATQPEKKTTPRRRRDRVYETASSSRLAPAFSSQSSRTKVTSIFVRYSVTLPFSMWAV